jgi:hypothetical protein
MGRISDVITRTIFWFRKGSVLHTGILVKANWLARLPLLKFARATNFLFFAILSPSICVKAQFLNVKKILALRNYWAD